MIKQNKAAKTIQQWYRKKRQAFFSENAQRSLLAASQEKFYDPENKLYKAWKRGNFDNPFLHQKYGIPEKKIIVFRYVYPYPELENVCRHATPLTSRLYQIAIALKIVTEAEVANIHGEADNIRVLQKIQDFKCPLKNSYDPENFLETYERYDSSIPFTINEKLVHSPWMSGVEVALSIYTGKKLTDSQVEYLQYSTAGGNFLDPFIYFTTQDLSGKGPSLEAHRAGIFSSFVKEQSKMLMIILAMDPSQTELFLSSNSLEQEWIGIGAVPYADIVDIVYLSEPTKSYLHEIRENKNLFLG